jgi:hypothetical protein
MFRHLKRMLDGREAIRLDEREANWRMTHGYVEIVADAITLAVTDTRASGCMGLVTVARSNLLPFPFVLRRL